MNPATETVRVGNLFTPQKNTHARARLNDYRVFWREFRQTFHTTGAVLPSGRSLCKALASQVGCDRMARRVLEVGPGTGAVTNEIIRRMKPNDRLDLVEINERFAATLRERLLHETRWRAVAGRVRVLEMPIEELPLEGKYECIVSGLPLNNFSCDAVARILAQFHQLGNEGCTLSFFEYAAIRRAKAMLSSAAERQRLLGIEKLLQDEFNQWEFSRQCVVANVPPAWVHHLRFAKAGPQDDGSALPSNGISSFHGPGGAVNRPVRASGSGRVTSHQIRNS